jgi:Tol biopolymer transport system component
LYNDLILIAGRLLTLTRRCRGNSNFTPLFLLLMVAVCSNAMAINTSVSDGGRPSSLNTGRNGVVSPDGRFIVYVDDDSDIHNSKSGTSLFVKFADKASRSRRLTDNSGRDDFPAFSRDGKDVYFHSDRGGLNKIWKVSLRGGKPSQITFGVSQEYHPAPSPDGQYLAYDSNRTGNYDIWLMNLSDYSERPLTTSPGPDFSPSWSPRGKALCYTGTDSSGFQIFLVKPFPEGQTPLQITQGRGVRAHSAWSPSGKYIAYDFGENGSVSLWLTRLKKPYKSNQITFSEWAEEGPCWYPDSDRLLYSVKNGGQSQLATVSVPIMLTEIEEASQSGAVQGVQVASAAGIPVIGPSFSFNEEPMEMPEDIDFMKGLSPSDNVDVPLESSPKGIAKSDNVFRAMEPAYLASDSSLVNDALGEEIANNFLGEVSDSSTTGIVLPYEEKNSFPLLENSSNISADEDSKGSVLRILQFYPKHERGGIDPPDSISVVFDKPVSPGNPFDELLTLIDDQGTIIPVLANYSPHLCRLDAIMRSPLDKGRKYTVTVSSSLLGASGEKLNRNFEWSFSTKGSAPELKVEIIKEITFSISEKRPSGLNASTSDCIECEFTKALNPASIDATGVMLFDSKGQKIPGNVEFPEGDFKLTLKPYAPLTAGEKYRVFVSQNITSADGEKLKGSLIWSFGVASSTPLQIIDYEPKGFLGPSDDVTLHFNRPLDSKSINTGQFFLKHGSDNYSGNTIVGMGGKSLLFVPHRRYPNNSELTLVVPPGLTDTGGRELEMEKPITFSVKFKADSGASVVDSLIERHSQHKVSTGAELSVLGKTKTESISVGSTVYEKLLSLLDKGFIDKNLGGDLSRKNVLSRYKAALLVESAIKNMQLMPSAQKTEVRALANEFKAELHSLGVKVAAIFGNSSSLPIGKA